VHTTKDEIAWKEHTTLCFSLVMGRLDFPAFSLSGSQQLDAALRERKKRSAVGSAARENEMVKTF
jgi:hypothetical protein